MENISIKNKKKIKVNIFLKIFLDIALMLTFILLMNSKIISMAFHEIAGIAIGVFFLVHKLLNLKWIKSVTKNIFGKKVNAQTRVRYILDVLLLFGVYTIIISGIFMSQVLFPQAVNSSVALRSIHTAVSYICIILIGLHIGLHWKWVMNGFSRMFKIKSASKVRKWLLRGAALALAIWGMAGIILSGFFTNIGFNFSATSIPGIHDKDINEENDPSGSNTPKNETTNDSAISNDSQIADDISITDDTSDTDNTADIETYLSGLNCTGCSKNCSLLYPMCSEGVKQQQQAIQEFEALNTTADSNQATVWNEDGINYLQVDTTVYTVYSSMTNTSDSGNTPSDTSKIDTDEKQEGTSPKGFSGRDGKGLSRQAGTQGAFDVILTFAPIVGFFGIIGYLIDRLFNRKKDKLEKTETSEIS